MTTAFQTGPGFYAANTRAVDKAIPAGVMRVYCARIEAYDLADDQVDLDTQFSLLVAMAEGKPQIAKALLSLADSIGGNRKTLEEFARA